MAANGAPTSAEPGRVQEPATPAETYISRLRRRTDRTTTTQGSAWSMVEPFLIIVIGIALMLVDANASEVSGVLRTPALIAGLILVAQGLNGLKAGGRETTTTTTTTTTTSSEPPAPANPPASPGAATNRTKEVNIPQEAPPPAPTGSSTLTWGVLILAVWLGLASLASPTAPRSLILLSLLSAILLFAEGWRMLRSR
jgi:hypothetical protein